MVEGFTTYHEDHDFPPYSACAGDDALIGAHGFHIDHRIPNTDPRDPDDEVARLAWTRRLVVGGSVEASVDALLAPMTITVRR